jgi:hypothetical protein
MARVTTINRTIVRFLAIGLLGLSGCVSADHGLYVNDARCPPATQRVCAVTGPERRCTCETRANVDRFLATFGSSTWSGAAH